jgi:23S rRNA (adenine2503-C2)-methyltransferase
MNFEEQINQTLKDANQPEFRNRQIFDARFGALAKNWDEVTVLPATLRDTLAKNCPWPTLEVISDNESSRGDTRKVAFKLHDGNIIETVLMRHNDGRRTICVSSQAGCPMRCAFCATGTLGLKRNLTIDEIIEQVLFFARELALKQERVSNVVLMGMGEPMHNYDAAIGALRIFNNPRGLNIGARHMSVSTCGIVPGILKLADEPMQLNLAISLHAPNDELRTKLMPVNIAYSLNKLMPAIETYIAKTNRKVFFEYLLIDSLNDTDEVAEELAKLMNHHLYHVNLIKYHTTGAFVSSPKEQRFRFMEILEQRGVQVTHRISFGEDIDAACGQLANKHVKK